MVTRRNIRIKVMQVLYQFHARQNDLQEEEAKKILQSRLNQISDAFIYLIYFLTETARYAESDAAIRSSKNIITESDRNVNVKIAGNSVLWKILETPSYTSELKNYVVFDDTKETVRKTYQQLTASQEYAQYIKEQNREPNSEKEILLFIMNSLMFGNEDFHHHIEEHFTNWDDDAEMLHSLFPSYISKPQSLKLHDLVGPEKTKFAKDLLVTVINKDDHLNELIKPKLKNWDAERIAVLDMILMQMGIAEFLYFETIPPKVTINEYIDIAKEYSTAQSGQFVNGILDSVHKDLLKENKIHKTDFKTKKS